jgi:predicted nucleic acid-binding protein
MNFVLDASVALGWLLEDASSANQPYSQLVFDQLEQSASRAFVSGVWPFEIANGIAKGERRGRVDENRSQRFLRALAAAPIEVDNESATKAQTETLHLARRFGLSAYDASYLELALRRSLPIATLDTDLLAAANLAGVTTFLAS